MSTEKFGQFLIEKGLATEEDIYMALNIQRSKRKPLGQIALEHDLLSVKQIFDTLNAQAESPDDLFGEISVRLGYMSHEDLEKVLKLQRENTPKIGEILVSLNIIPQDKCDRMLRHFHMLYNHPLAANTSMRLH